LRALRRYPDGALAAFDAPPAAAGRLRFGVAEAAAEPPP